MTGKKVNLKKDEDESGHLCEIFEGYNYAIYYQRERAINYALLNLGQVIKSEKAKLKLKKKKQLNQSRQTQADIKRALNMESIYWLEE